MQVYNRDIHVHYVNVRSIASSSLFLIGDAETIQSYSMFDTPLSSLLIGPLVPLSPEV